MFGHLLKRTSHTTSLALSPHELGRLTLPLAQASYLTRSEAVSSLLCPL